MFSFNDYLKNNKTNHIRDTTLNDRIYLNVPYKQKNHAKRLGAQWDADKRKWYMNKKAPNNYSWEHNLKYSLEKWGNK